MSSPAAWPPHLGSAGAAPKVHLGVGCVFVFRSFFVITVRPEGLSGCCISGWVEVGGGVESRTCIAGMKGTQCQHGQESCESIHSASLLDGQRIDCILLHRWKCRRSNPNNS